MAISRFSTREEIIEHAEDLHVRDGKLEIDAEAIVSKSEDGAYVSAWRWVENDSEGRIEVDDDTLVSEGDDPGAYVEDQVWVAFDVADE